MAHEARSATLAGSHQLSLTGARVGSLLPGVEIAVVEQHQVRTLRRMRKQLKFKTFHSIYCSIQSKLVLHCCQLVSPLWIAGLVISDELWVSHDFAVKHNKFSVSPSSWNTVRIGLFISQMSFSICHLQENYCLNFLRIRGRWMLILQALLLALQFVVVGSRIVDSHDSI